MNSNRKVRLVSLVGVSAAALIAGMSITPAVAQVTFDRLLNADEEPENWLTNHGNYSSHRHSGLDQIDRSNVGGLNLAFAVALSGVETGNNSMQATPLVDNGAMYVVNGWGVVSRIDVSSGDRGTITWDMDPGVDPSAAGIRANRGVALLGDSVYTVSFDGRVNRTAAATGELLYSVVGLDPVEQPLGYLTAAPLAVNDSLIIGSSGADSGVRGWIQSHDAETGDINWRRYIIPSPGEPGSETWLGDWNAWEVGGGSAWVTGSYDAEQNLLIWGTGNPAPDFDNSARPGDNLYTNSALALDADSGEIAWYFQYTPNDVWDFDEVGVHTLFDVEIDGTTRRVLGHSARNGFYYTLDRVTGEFVAGDQYVTELNWTAGIDQKTGLPIDYDPNSDVQSYAGIATPTHDNPIVEVCPTIGGGNNYYPSSYDPSRQLYYIQGIENCSRIEQIAYGPGEWDVGENPGFGQIQPTNPQSMTSLTAVDVTTGEVVNQVIEQYASYGGLLSTEGDLLFGGYLDGSFKAYDLDTLDVLWSINMGTPFNAPPISYEVDGQQYIAIIAGVGFIARSNLTGDEIQNIKTTSYLFVFSL